MVSPPDGIQHKRPKEVLVKSFLTAPAIAFLVFVATDARAANPLVSLVKDINPGASDGALPYYGVVNGILYFQGKDGTYGEELWRSDGTAAGTVMIFSATDTAGIEPWRSDGTPAGTYRLTDLNNGGTANAESFVNVGGTVMFIAADNGMTGREFWRIVRTRSDFDGEGKADAVVYRPAAGQWWINRSLANFSTSFTVQWGVQVAGDVPTPADFDGDGKIDPTVFRPADNGNAFWFVNRSRTNYADAFAVHWGTTGDLPVPGSDDGDRRADPAVYRPSTGQWLISKSSEGYSTGIVVEWGVASDIPVPADYDGDGRTDIAIYRPSIGQWLVKRSSTEFASVFVVQWGVNAEGDIPIPADYDGDGKSRSCRLSPRLGPLAREPVRRELRDSARDSMGRSDLRRPAGACGFRRRRAQRSHDLSARHGSVVHPALARRLRDVPGRAVG
jgi:ELWxxDGT repeat protein